MNLDTVNLLKECNSGCKNATSNMEKVLEYVKNGKLKEIIESYNMMHMKIGNACRNLLNESNEEEKDPSRVVLTFAEWGTDLKLHMENSAHKVADIMIDGCNMGIKSISEYINKYCTADEESKKIANNLVKIEKDFMDELLQFL